MSLAAPASYWVCGGTDPFTPWILWVVMTLKSAAAIVHVLVRLEQNVLEQPLAAGEAWRMGRVPLLHHATNLAVAVGLAAAALVPWAVPLAFAVTVADGAEAVARPPRGRKVSHIGLRQLGVSIAFVLVVVIGYLWP